MTISRGRVETILNPSEEKVKRVDHRIWGSLYYYPQILG
jgi:hypothetical protein